MRPSRRPVPGGEARSASLLLYALNISHGDPQKAKNAMSLSFNWMPRRLTLAVVAAAAMAAAGCSSSMNSAATSSVTGPAFVVGTDAPLASVTSFQVQVQSVDAIDANGNSVSLISGEPTVDFARYNGLQTLLDMNDVPAGTYSKVQITLGTGTIGYLNTNTGGAPKIETEAATFTSSTATVNLATPLVVVHAGTPVGLRVDFNLAKSIQVDATGNFTGTVTPTFDISAVKTTDADAHIDEYTAAVVSVNASAQSFVVQGPHGEQFTVLVNGQTEWDRNESINSLTTNSIVQVSGHLDNADQTLDADEVEIVSQNGFYASGQVTYVIPPAGTATSFDLYVRALLPTTTGLQLGQIATVDLSGSEKFMIFRMNNPMTQFLFNSSAMVAGQAIAVGGPASGAANASAVTVNRVSLRPWGFNGTVVANSVNTSQGSFQMHVNGFAGVLIPETITVYVGDNSEFRDGFSGLSDLGGGANVRVVGLLLRDSTSGQVVLLGKFVDAMDQ
jgi:hypothetical protein